MRPWGANSTARSSAQSRQCVHSSVAPAGSSSRSTRMVDTNEDRMSSVVAPSRSSRFRTAYKTAIRTATRTRALSGLDFGFRTNIPNDAGRTSHQQGEHHTHWNVWLAGTGDRGWATGGGLGLHSWDIVMALCPRDRVSGRTRTRQCVAHTSVRETPRQEEVLQGGLTSSFCLKQVTSHNTPPRERSPVLRGAYVTTLNRVCMPHAPLPCERAGRQPLIGCRFPNRFPLMRSVCV